MRAGQERPVAFFAGALAAVFAAVFLAGAFAAAFEAVFAGAFAAAFLAGALAAVFAADLAGAFAAVFAGAAVFDAAARLAGARVEPVDVLDGALVVVLRAASTGSAADS